MTWLAANWLWIVIGVAFVLFHMVGHGGHGGHGSKRSNDDAAGSAPPVNDQNQPHVH